MYVKLDQQRFISMIAKDPANDKDAQNLKGEGFIEVHPLASWLPYMANFANKFYVDQQGVMHAPGNLPVTALQKAFNDVKSQLNTANTSIDSLKSTNADLVKQVNSVASDNKQLVADADKDKQSIQGTASIVNSLVAQVFQLKSQLAHK